MTHSVRNRIGGTVAPDGAPSERDAQDDGEMISVDDFDLRLFEAEGEPAAYRAWALRLAEKPDTANDAILLAMALRGVDEPGFYRTRNLLRGTTFAEL
jgi:hypothetical protein